MPAGGIVLSIPETITGDLVVPGSDQFNVWGTAPDQSPCESGLQILNLLPGWPELTHQHVGLGHGVDSKGPQIARTHWHVRRFELLRARRTGAVDAAERLLRRLMRLS